ncbi:unnamed protein product [Blepharisma stoltei]|uniref:Reverse transcriptase domain-containing protein n=1 Tax=Blepharisma stoltei TaxID=1481888 RepID=A0AAU9IRM4_9CILI|nr:unnamed protein product [Blepharisma stoltei]
MKAFDSVERRILLEVMAKRGVDRKLIALARAMVSDEESMIIMNGEQQKPIKINRGVRQGGCSLPVCFNFIPNELAWKIEELGLGVQLEDGLKIGILLYADDIVLIAENPHMLRELVRATESWAEDYKIEINQEKSEIMTFGKSCEGINIRINGNLIKEVKAYKYLGYALGKRVKNTYHLDERVSKMRTAMCLTLGRLKSLKNLQMQKKLTILRACINSVGLYGLEVTGSTLGAERVLEQLEVIQRRWIRWLMSAPQGVANETLYMDSGIMSMEMQLAVRVLNYRLKLERELKRGTMLGKVYELNVKQELSSWAKMSAKWSRWWSLMSWGSDDKRKLGGSLWAGWCLMLGIRISLELKMKFVQQQGFLWLWMRVKVS